MEEETIEEEEYDFNPLKAQHGEDGDLEELEEETLQQQIRSGALGEMLQEAHLDHRIQLSRDEDDDAEEEESGAPAGGGRTGSGAAPGGRERGGRTERGRRGRGPGGSERSSSQSGSGGGDGRRPGGGGSRRSAQTSDLPIISDLLKPGQEILVQIAKEPIAKKGARITSHIALPGTVPGVYADGEPCGREPQDCFG